jgi:tetratricopeptide (TPR) repeat protein
MTKKRDKFILPLCLVGLLFSTILLQKDFADHKFGKRIAVPECPWCDERAVDDVVFIPLNASIMRLFSPADPLFLGDILWMRMSYYFGQHMLTDRDYPYLLHMLDLITDLTPGWIQPYLFGAVVLPSETESVEDGFYIIDKGLLFHPDNWQLWFFKGFYLWQMKNDLLGASEALNKASQLENAPAYLINLAASFATKGGHRALAVEFLKEALKNVQDATQRKMILKKMTEVLESDIQSTPVE